MADDPIETDETPPQVDRAPYTGPQNHPPVIATPEPESMTPLLPIDDDPEFNKRPDIARLEAHIDAGRYPSEPHMVILPHKTADETLRDLAKFAIISRLLFRNHKNTEILAQLAEAGHIMADSTLRKLMRRSDFLDYYEKYRNQLMEPLDKQIRDDFKLAMPEAFTKVVSLMRKARNERIQGDMAIAILEGGGGLRKDRTDRKVVFNVPPELQKAMFEAGSKILADLPLLAPPSDDDPSKVS
jgi:hypothetical protein